MEMREEEEQCEKEETSKDNQQATKNGDSWPGKGLKDEYEQKTGGNREKSKIANEHI
jgi:hypothetical protein